MALLEMVHLSEYIKNVNSKQAQHLSSIYAVVLVLQLYNATMHHMLTISPQ